MSDVFEVNRGHWHNVNLAVHYYINLQDLFLIFFLSPHEQD